MTFTEATAICAEQEQLIIRQIEAIRELQAERDRYRAVLVVIGRMELNQQDSDGDCQSCFSAQMKAREVLQDSTQDEYERLVLAILEVNESAYAPFNAANLVVRSAQWVALLEMIGGQPKAASVGG